MSLFKLFLTSALWTMIWAGYFATIGAPATLINFAIVFLPLILALAYLYFIIFVWDD